MDDEYTFRPSWMEIDIPQELPKRFHTRNLVFGYMNTTIEESSSGTTTEQVFYDGELDKLFIVNNLPSMKLSIVYTDSDMFNSRYVFDSDEFESIKKLWTLIGEM